VTACGHSETGSKAALGEEVCSNVAKLKLDPLTAEDGRPVAYVRNLRVRFVKAG
jgi:hypothetical protein